MVGKPDDERHFVGATKQQNDYSRWDHPFIDYNEDSLVITAVTMLVVLCTMYVGTIDLLKGQYGSLSL